MALAPLLSVFLMTISICTIGYIATSSQSGLRVWNSQTSTLIYSLNADTSQVSGWQIALSPDGTKLAYGGYNGVLEIIELPQN